MRSLKTHTREGGLSVKIVLARFAPSKNANLSKSANFRFASLTPLATNPSAQLYGGLVTMFSGRWRARVVNEMRDLIVFLRRSIDQDQFRRLERLQNLKYTRSTCRRIPCSGC